MKKLLVLIVPVLLLMFACNNKPATETAVVSTDSLTVTDSSATAADTTEAPVGNPTMPAQVFEDATAKPVAGATVVVLENDKALESALTDDKGFYTTVKTLAGHSYTFTCSKTGFVTQSKKAVYESAGSLPLFALVAK